MKVSVLAYDISHNCLGRAYVLARIVEQEHKVEIIGPQLKDSIWAPLADKYDYKSVQGDAKIYKTSLFNHLSDMIAGDIVYASKPRATSFGIGLLKKARDDAPLLLDIDDWETRLHNTNYPVPPYITEIPSIFNSNSIYYTKLLEKMTQSADQVTVSNSTLQKEFGGEILRHVRDTNKFDPSQYRKLECRKRLNINKDDLIVLFFGTPRPHKGIEQLIGAVEKSPIKDLKLIIVGADSGQYSQSIKQKTSENVKVVGPQPFDEVPNWYAASDIACIPQQRRIEASGQLPAKLFDAMAMGKAIVSTSVSDIPTVLNDCGIITESGSEDELQNAIDRLAENSKLREELGEAARNRCVTYYSLQAASQKLNPLIDQVSA